jgi:23S rRNA pseudouridine1911/1915/1917 synthase
MPVHVLYEEGPCLVVLKPAGVLTQAPPGIDSMEARIKSWLKQRDNKPGNVYLGVPHRLDRPVSGAMVFGKHVRAARRLAEQFEARTVHKTYWACVEGKLSPAAGTWTDFVRKVPDQPRAEIVPEDAADAKPAVLHYRTLGRSKHGAWLEIELETGRMHQIRLQAAHRGHPVVGDTLYGAPTRFGAWLDDVRQRAIALHGRTLAFRHPMTWEQLSVTAPLSVDWEGLELVENPS